MVNNFEQGVWEESTYAQHSETLFAFIRKAKTERFRIRMMQELGIEPWVLHPVVTE